MAFPDNAPTRRMLLLAAVTTLAVLPWLLASVDAVWLVSLEALPSITLSVLLPNFLLWLWLGVAGVLVGQHLTGVGREIRGLRMLCDIDDHGLRDLTNEVTGELGMRMPRLKQGDCACSLSMGEPMLVLPQDWRRWDEIA